MSDINNPNESLQALYEQVVQGWLSALSLREMETTGHHLRVANFAVELGKALGLGDQQLTDLRYGALLHDIGKLAVPDSILFKPGPLTEFEQEIVKRHTKMGADVLRQVSFLQNAAVIAEAHHERWDGEGYPNGLKGEEIPQLARIAAVAGTYDALRSDRIYRQAWSHEKAIAFLKENAGTAYDPGVVEKFITMFGDER